MFLFSAAFLHAVPPPPGMTAPNQSVCRVNPAAQSARAAALQGAPFFPLPLAPTTAYVAVVRVDFSDQAMTKTKSETERFMESLKNFYLENSYGVLTVSATVTNRTAGGSAGAQGAYRMPQTLAAYAQGICTNYDQLAKDGLRAANTDYVLSPFNHVMVYHAGIGAETADDSACQTDNVWSVFAPTVPATASQTDGILNSVISSFSFNGAAFNGATFVPESESQGIDPLGVICHEYGHQLGLPDLYKASAQSVVGKWSLMDSGIYIGSPQGSNPAHLDAWSKQYLGFSSSPQTLSISEDGQNIILGYSPSSPGALIRIPISGLAGIDGNKEYFLVERRARSSLTGKTFDDALPYGPLGEGFLIWHVDDNIMTSESRLAQNNVNAGTPNFGLDLVEADGKGVIATTSGQESDPFPGSSGKNLFAAPLSNTFGGQQTGILVSGFYNSSLTAKKAFASGFQEIAKVINFPNPGGPAYPQRSGAPGGTVTTILLNTTKPAQKLRLTLHDLSGSLVKDVPEHLIRANGTASGTHKFVYEYDWDGRTDSNEPVAPGVYLYRFRADDDKSKTGKLVIVK